MTMGVLTGSSPSWPDGMGTVGADEAAGAVAVTTARGGRGRGTCGGVLARRAHGRGTPRSPKPYSTAGGAAPASVSVHQRVRVEMRPEGGKVVGGTSSPGGERVDVAASVITAELTPCEVFDGVGLRQPGLRQSPHRLQRARQKPKC